jgi:hypothetical protein
MSSGEEEGAIRASSRRSSKRKVNYVEDSDEEDQGKDSSEMSTPKPTKKRPASTKKKEEEPEEDDTSEVLEEEQVVKSKKVARDRTFKEQLIAELLCRWWYVLPDWPPKDFDYATELKKRGLRLVTLDEWEDAHDLDPQSGLLKCYALNQFPGVFRDAKKNLIDCRPAEGKPSFNNLNKKSEKELAALVKKAYQAQIALLEKSREKALVKELEDKLKNIK